MRMERSALVGHLHCVAWERDARWVEDEELTTAGGWEWKGGGRRKDERKGVKVTGE